MHVVRSTCMFKFMHVGMACQHENVLYVDIQMFAYTHVEYCHVNMFDVTCEHCCLSNVDIQYRGRQYLKHACCTAQTFGLL